MRLLKVDTLQLVEPRADEIPKYAILSHTWGREEVSFADMIQPDSKAGRKKEGWYKIESACRQARADGLGFVWVDTCCIDKSSSAELSEAINSMYAWYGAAECCYAYLADVEMNDSQTVDEAGYSSSNLPTALGPEQSTTTDEIGPNFPSELEPGKLQLHAQIKSSRWFRRGWTLQELIAPQQVRFFDSQWLLIGSRQHFARLIEDITNIDVAVLRRQKSLQEVSIARRMSWASNRVTTRVEDIAYCLLGIFDVNLPLIYGEGQKAFLRLQEEIIRASDDQSIFAWNKSQREIERVKDSQAQEPSLRGHSGIESGLLATCPGEFRDAGDVVHVRDLNRKTAVPFAMTNMGLSIELLVMARPPRFAAILECVDRAKSKSRRLMVYLNLLPGSDDQYVRWHDSAEPRLLNPVTMDGSIESGGSYAPFLRRIYVRQTSASSRIKFVPMINLRLDSRLLCSTQMEGLIDKDYPSGSKFGARIEEKHQNSDCTYEVLSSVDCSHHTALSLQRSTPRGFWRENNGRCFELDCSQAGLLIAVLIQHRRTQDYLIVLIGRGFRFGTDLELYIVRMAQDYEGDVALYRNEMLKQTLDPGLHMSLRNLYRDPGLTRSWARRNTRYSLPPSLFVLQATNWRDYDGKVADVELVSFTPPGMGYYLFVEEFAPGLVKDRLSNPAPDALRRNMVKIQDLLAARKKGSTELSAEQVGFAKRAVDHLRIRLQESEPQGGRIRGLVGKWGL